MSFIETEEQKELRASVSKLGERFNYVDYVLPKARKGEPLTELWNEAGKLGFLGVNLPEEYGGGGAGIYELALVQEELAAQGAGHHRVKRHAPPAPVLAQAHRLLMSARAEHVVIISAKRGLAVAHEVEGSHGGGF